MKDLVFITGNQHKAAQLGKWLGTPIEHRKLDLEELQVLDLQAVVEHKARQAYGLLKKPVLVEDVSLEFTAMGRLPGTFIKWFLQELGADGLGKLAAALDSQAAINRVMYGLYDGQTMRTFLGEIRGSIAPAPRGTNGFGFDVLFVHDGYTQTRAELDDDMYRKLSARAQAIDKLREYLDKHAN